MELRLYNFSKKHNSTKQLGSDATPIATYSDVFLKQNTDIDNPTFLIDDTLHDVNYAYLVTIGRFYFVKSMRLGNNNIWEIECELDALATYKTQILLHEAFVERCADSNYYNIYLNDPLISVKQGADNYDRHMEIISGFSGNGSYVMRVVGGDSDGVSTFVTSDLSQWAAIFDPDTYFTSGAAWYEILGNIIFNPWDYIISLSWSPISLDKYISEGAYDSDIWIKWFNTNITAKKLPNNKVTYINSGAFSFSSLYSDFRRYNPSFTRWKLYIPAVGLVDMDNIMATGQISVNYCVNLDSGSAAVDVVNQTQGLIIIAHYNCDLYVSLQAGSDSWNAGGIISNLGGATGNFVAGNIAAGSANLVEAIGNIIVPTPQGLGGSNGIGIRSDPNIYALSICHGSGNIPTAVAGRPCMKNVLLSNLTGFVKCGNASVDIACDESTKLEINAYLNNGFFIE